MIDIFTSKIQFTKVQMSHDMMFEIVMDSGIKPDTFIKFKFSDGSQGAIRKKDIIGFTDSWGGSENIMAVSTMNILVICITLVILKLIKKMGKGD